MKWLNKIDSFSFIVGRSMLGLYFIGPGLSKVLSYSATLALMKIKGVPFSSILLPATIAIQVFGGLLLLLGRNLRIASLILFGLTIMINIFIHNFWTLAGDPTYPHEAQNFIKNLAIGAGLLVLATKDKN
tara:strand:- start:507 stop:896 length:390 start_codon:yes stop_codon:yes gene_type:complete